MVQGKETICNKIIEQIVSNGLLLHVWVAAIQIDGWKSSLRWYSLTFKKGTCEEYYSFDAAEVNVSSCL